MTMGPNNWCRALGGRIAPDVWVAVNPTARVYMFRIPPGAIAAARDRFG